MRRIPTILLLLLMAGCTPSPLYRSGVSPSSPVTAKNQGRSETAEETTIIAPGAWPLSVEQGLASYYGREFHGRKTANGERFDMNGLTAAHRTLPFGTVVRVTNLSNNKSVTVRINDRGPFVEGRIIDLAQGAAKQIGLDGVEEVRLEIIKYPEK
jgi:rare lipoprotein A